MEIGISFIGAVLADGFLVTRLLARIDFVRGSRMEFDEPNKGLYHSSRALEHYLKVS